MEIIYVESNNQVTAFLTWLFRTGLKLIPTIDVYITSKL